MPGGVRTELHLTGEDTDGALCMMVDEPPPGWSLPPHRHLNESETIHVVDGEFDIVVDGERSLLGPGDTVHVPRGAVHSGGNVGTVPGRRVIVFAPAGVEGFFLEVGDRDPAADVDVQAVLDSARRHGWEFAGAARDGG